MAPPLWSRLALRPACNPHLLVVNKCFQRGLLPSPPRTRSIGGFIRLVATGFVLTAAGFLMTAGTSLEALGPIINPVTDEQSLKLYEASRGVTEDIESTINSHPVVLDLRQNADFTESRPHLKIPPAFRDHNLTGGTLMGPGKVEVPPYAWSQKGGKSLVTISYLGTDLCGHPGIVHGGFLATMLDEGLARCCFPALPHNVGMTANLNINYKSPAQAGSYVVLRATTTKVEGRKAWVEGRIETLPRDGETPVVIADATGLFISPRQAATMKRAYPIN
ncbi:UPF0644 protein [Zalerion maritima]|uniref:UPF0644 protein n=1 Tax=Zalerion maritima TaxID=339359 RepID=A0AAD5WUI2_9PEZI|nr:UPF0644 protein [Zalerion maritima]